MAWAATLGLSCATGLVLISDSLKPDMEKKVPLAGAAVGDGLAKGPKKGPLTPGEVPAGECESKGIAMNGLAFGG